VLEKKIPDCKHLIIPFALGEKKKIIDFFVNNFNDTCASNSTLNHYYLNHKIKVNQITLDSLIATKKIKKINFLKLDVEGAEYQCLLGAKESLRKGIIEYIQLEYDQTWLEAGGSIKKILGLCKEFGYKLYRIDSKRLLSISKYNFNLDDFSYSNLLMVKNGSRLPLPCNREAIPLTI
jgi:FkbM family methyltransferase